MLCEKYPKTEVDKIWQDTLLNQFHDILPGSSINWVYKDAHKMSRNNLKKLDKIQISLLEQLHKTSECVPNDFGTLRNVELFSQTIVRPCGHSDVFTIWNSQPWDRTEIITLPNKKEIEVAVPSLGYVTIKFNNVRETALSTICADSSLLDETTKHFPKKTIEDICNKYTNRD